MDRRVDILFGDGYLEPNFRTDRFDLDSGSEENHNALRTHEEFRKEYMIMNKKPVWKLFEGKGDHTQLRAEEVNDWRWKKPAEPLEDGTEPWF